MRVPYIGLCDIPNAEFARGILDVFAACKSPEARRLMIGVMTSYKRLNRQPTKWEKIYPPLDEIAAIFVDHPLAMNTVHYADYEGIDVEDSLAHATMCGGERMHALQLDMVWPYPDVISSYRTRHPGVELILQVGERALGEMGDDPTRVVEALRRYEGAFDWVLLDKSGGRGVGLKADVLVPFVRAVQAGIPALSIAVAGALGPDTLDRLDPLLPLLPSIAIDAQSQLRTSGSSLDPMEWDRARLYVERAVAKLSTV